MTFNSTKGLREGTPSLFQPAVIRSIANEPQEAITFNLLEASVVADTTVDETGSFKYDTPGTGLKSTQQLNIDWSDFSNHTFFNSAQVKVNVAFDRIQNSYPFDGTNKEVETFLDALTGYEKYVLDNYPKNKGYLFFSGTNGTEGFGGTYITVKDMAGAAFPNLSRKHNAETIINPGDSSMTVEYWLYAPSISSSNQVIVDKHSGSMGFMITLENTGSVASGSTTFRLVSGSITDNISVDFDKGAWNHFAWVWNRTPGVYTVSSFVNGIFKASSSMPIEFGTFSAKNDMLIGSGSSLGDFSPTSTLSGALDEFRIWHSIRDLSDIRENMEKIVYSSEDLKLYYKLNEPSGSNSNLVIDASSNSLHGKLSTAGVSLGVRQFATSSIAGESPMTYELLDQCPILFPTQPDVVDYRLELLVSGSSFDKVNPNIITRLIPKHYLLEGQIEDALETEEGDIVSALSTGVDPRTTKLGATQVLLLLLYTWAKFFDEMKLYTQAFSDINFVDYDIEDTVPDQFLQRLARSQGIELPPLFVGSSVGQFINANNIQGNISKNNLTLQYIQNQIWRRILVNLRDIVSSKGTAHGVKTFIRSVGIDPDNNFRIREYGGPTKRSLTYVRDNRNEISTMLNFASGGLITSPFLTGSKIEPGFPTNGPTALDNGLLTSGSFTFEGTYRFIPNQAYEQTQSLLRVHTTGSSVAGFEGLIANLVAISGAQQVSVFIQPAPTTITALELKVSGSGVDLFDGDKWYVSFGRQRGDDGDLGSTLSASYFLRVAKQEYGTLTTTATTQSYYLDFPIVFAPPSWQNRSGTSNASGSYFKIGSGSINSSTLFLGNTTNAPETARATSFQGRTTQLRFWSKYLEETEWPEHVRDFKSKGVQDPLTNFSFVTYKSGSFGRLRIDTSTDQEITESNSSGEITIFDFSQNGFHLTGTNFLATSSVIVPERFYYSYISPKFDEASTTEKVRIRSFLNYENVQNTPWAQVAPVYEIPRSEEPTDSTRFTIDYSIVDALNEDIINIFSTLDALDNVIGNPELMFSPDYPELEDLRTVYFNRLTDKINLKNFFEFYKWFDTNVGTFVAQLIPRKTKFIGTNFVIESHMLERPKMEYLFSDIYLGDNTRSSLRDTILLQLFVGEFSRY